MNAGQHIRDAKYWVDTLKGKMPFIKDQVKLDKHVQLINTIINLVNDVEFLIDNTYKGDVIEKLILARFYSQIFPLYRPDDKIDIKQIIKNIDDNITQPKGIIEANIIDFLQGKEIDYELTKVNPNLQQITSSEEYQHLLDDMVQQVKEHIEWN